MTSTRLITGASHGNVLGGLSFDLPVRGTMAHSYIQSHDDETEALRRYARDYPGTTLLVDTYDTLRGVDRVIALVRATSFSTKAARTERSTKTRVPFEQIWPVE